MIENVIVTLRCLEREFDVELPAGVKIGKLKPAIFEAMRRRGICLENGFLLESNGYSLKETDTLLEAGVWDGSYLNIL